MDSVTEQVELNLNPGIVTIVLTSEQQELLAPVVRVKPLRIEKEWSFSPLRHL
jgi:hypothetical protein